MGANCLLPCRFLRHNLVGLLIKPLPAILLLTGDNKHLLSRPWLAIPGDVDVRYIAHPVQRGRQQAQVSHVPALHSARAARRLPKHHDVLGHRPGNAQQQPSAIFPVSKGQLPDWIGLKNNRGRRYQQKFLLANARPGAIQALEKLLTS
jgi:hypothetical protein